MPCGSSRAFLSLISAFYLHYYYCYISKEFFYGTPSLSTGQEVRFLCVNLAFLAFSWGVYDENVFLLASYIITKLGG